MYRTSQKLVFAAMIVAGINFAASVTTNIQAKPALPPYTNVIIFGDSQSDIGNGPESETLIDGDSIDPIFTNLYVPISNPANPAHLTILPQLHHFFAPHEDARFHMTLPAQLPLCSGKPAQCRKRDFRSLNWVGYFMFNAVRQGLIAAPADLRPWIIQYQDTRHHKRRGKLSESVDYAWYSALSDNHCHNFNYRPQTCLVAGEPDRAASYYATQDFYRRKQSLADIKYNKLLRGRIIIPAAQQQVELLADDLRHRRVAVSPDTLYIIQSGGNDLAVVFDRDFPWHPMTFYRALTQVIPDRIADPRNPNAVVSRLLRLGAKHILVIGQYNLAMTPEFLSKLYVNAPMWLQWLVADIFGLLIDRFNNALAKRIVEYTNDNNRRIDVRYVDIQRPLTRLIKHDQTRDGTGYHDTLGQNCDMLYEKKLAQGQTISCYRPKRIGWWNKAHLSTQSNQLIAATLLKAAMPTK